MGGGESKAILSFRLRLHSGLRQSGIPPIAREAARWMGHPNVGRHLCAGPSALDFFDGGRPGPSAQAGIWRAFSAL